MIIMQKREEKRKMRRRKMAVYRYTWVMGNAYSGQISDELIILAKDDNAAMAKINKLVERFRKFGYIIKGNLERGSMVTVKCFKPTKTLINF